MDDLNYEKFMAICLQKAKEAGEIGEIPVGAMIIKDGEILATAHNLNRRNNDATQHAEILVIQKASAIIGNERLIDCELVVTKEPCVMCTGAAIHARIKKIVIGAKDPKLGACGTVFDIGKDERLNHKPEIIFGIMEEECSNILKDFFKDLRNQKKKK